MQENRDSQANNAGAHRTDDARRHFYQVWMIVGAAVVLYILGFVLDVLAMPVAILAWTMVIVLCLRGPVGKLEAFGVPRVVGTAISYAGTAVVAGILLGVMFSPASGIAEQFSDMLAGLPGYVQGVIDWANRLYEQYAAVLQNESVRDWLNSAAEALTSWASATARLSADGVLGFGTSVVNSAMVIGFALVVAFWILMELPRARPRGKALRARASRPRGRDAAPHVHARDGRLYQGHAHPMLPDRLGVRRGLLGHRHS